MRSAIAKLATARVTGAKKNFHSIDLLRGVAALTILVFHFKNFTVGGGALSRGPEALDRIGLLTWLTPLRQNGAVAVMLFWAISGFVFMNVYAGLRSDFRQFWMNRIARLYPLHIITLLVIAAIQAQSLRMLGHWVIYPENDLPHFMAHIFFASAWLPGAPHSFNGPVWSVSIEVLIYGVFFLYVRYLPSNLATAILGTVVSGIFMKIFPASQIPVCGAYFFGGMSAYAVFRLWPARAMPVLLSCAIFALALCILISLGIGNRVPLTLRLLPIFASLLVVAAASEQIGLAQIFRRTQFIGDITYSTYMWHSSLQATFLLGAGVGLWSVDIAFTNVFFVSYLLVTCGLGWLSFRLIERPAQRWIRTRGLRQRSDKPLISAP